MSCESFKLLADLLYNKTALSGVCIVPTTFSWSKNAVAHLFPMLYIPCLNFTVHSWVKSKTGIKSLATTPVRTPHLQAHCKLSSLQGSCELVHLDHRWPRPWRSCL